LEELDLTDQSPETDFSDVEILEALRGHKNIIKIIGCDDAEEITALLEKNKEDAKTTLQKFLSIGSIKDFQSPENSKFFEEEFMPRADLLLSMMKNPENYDFIDDENAAKIGLGMINKIKEFSSSGLFEQIAGRKIPQGVIFSFIENSGRSLEMDLLGDFGSFLNIPSNQFVANLTSKKVSPEIVRWENFSTTTIIKLLDLTRESFGNSDTTEFFTELLNSTIVFHPGFDEILERFPKLKDLIAEKDLSKSLDYQKAQNRLLGNNSFKQADEFQTIINSSNGIGQRTISTSECVKVVITEPKEANQEQIFKIQILNKGILNQEHLIEERPVLHCLSEFIRENTPYDDSRKRPRIEGGEETKRLKPDTSKPQKSPITQIPNEIILSKSDFEKLLHKLKTAEEEEVKLNPGRFKN
jgi:hypothetical protein